MKYSTGRPSSRYVTPVNARIGRFLLDAEVPGDLRGRSTCLDRADAAVELETELSLVGLEQGAVTHVELENRSAERVRHVRGRHHERLAVEEAQPLEQHDLFGLGQFEHRSDMRGDRLDLEP